MSEKPKHVLGLTKVGSEEPHPSRVATRLSETEMAYFALVNRRADGVKEYLDNPDLPHRCVEALDYAHSLALPLMPECEDVTACRYCAVAEDQEDFLACEQALHSAGRLTHDVFLALEHRGYAHKTVADYEYITEPSYKGEYRSRQGHELLPNVLTERMRHHLQAARNGVKVPWCPE